MLREGSVICYVKIGNSHIVENFSGQWKKITAISQSP